MIYKRISGGPARRAMDRNGQPHVQVEVKQPPGPGPVVTGKRRLKKNLRKSGKCPWGGGSAPSDIQYIDYFEIWGGGPDFIIFPKVQ